MILYYLWLRQQPIEPLYDILIIAVVGVSYKGFFMCTIKLMRDLVYHSHHLTDGQISELIRGYTEYVNGAELSEIEYGLARYLIATNQSHDNLKIVEKENVSN